MGAFYMLPVIKFHSHQAVGTVLFHDIEKILFYSRNSNPRHFHWVLDPLPLNSLNDAELIEYVDFLEKQDFGPEIAAAHMELEVSFADNQKRHPKPANSESRITTMERMKELAGSSNEQDE